MPYQHYVLGFAFSADGSRLVLLEKQSPDWQRGKLNGVGGKIEPGETPLACMIREFAEEAGVTTTPGQWLEFAHLSGSTFRVHAYALFDDTVVAAARTIEVHEIRVVPSDWNAISDKAISNLRWLIPAAIDAGLHEIEGDRIKMMTVEYTD